MTTEKIKYPSINGLRAISILFVLVHHASFQSDIFLPLVKVRWIQPLVLFIQNGQLGVNVFFVLSGFLITSLLINEEAKHKTISIKQFYIRRTLRIFPAYFAMLGVYAILQFYDQIELSRNSWLTALTYTKYFNWDSDWMTAHAWSLSVEEQFYLFWPFAFIGGVKQRKITSICLILIVPIIRTFSHYYPVEWINELTLFLRIDAIAFGCLVALYKDEILAKINGRWKPIFYISLLALFCMSSIPLIQNKMNIDFFVIPFGSSFGSFSNIFIAGILVYSVFGPKGQWFKFLNTKTLNFIGLISYSLYIWQQYFYSKDFNFLQQVPFNTVFVFIAAILSYYAIEKPFLTLKSKFSKSA